jgi:hypothetical protein
MRLLVAGSVAAVIGGLALPRARIDGSTPLNVDGAL